MLHARLREQTRRDHALLEKNLLQRISEINDVPDYIALLSMLYGYYAAAENLVIEHFQNAPEIDFLRRRKAVRILEDIAVYNTGYPTPRVCTKLPRLRSFHSALGVLYVLEGSTLGGRIIAQLISKKLNIDSGLNFFLSYGNDVDKMWISFTSVLQEPCSPEQCNEAIAGAIETFKTFNYWLIDHEQDKL